MDEKGRGIKKLQKSHADVKYSIGEKVNNIVIILVPGGDHFLNYIIVFYAVHLKQISYMIKS